jgi:flagellar hook-basal body complex protein FliE
MDVSKIDNLLSQMRAGAAIAAGGAKPAVAVAKSSAGQVDFAGALKKAIDQVNTVQNDATRLSQDFELGTGTASLQDVMIGMQKANLSFQQAVQVRNRLVSAYHDIMNMQV